MSKRIESSRTAIRTERDLSRKKNPLENVSASSPSEEKSTFSTDDATGLSISVSLRTDMRSFAQALIHVNEGISLLSIVDDLIDELQAKMEHLQEMSGETAEGLLIQEVQKIRNLYQQIEDNLSDQQRGTRGLTAVAGEDEIKLSFVVSTDDWERLEAADLVVDDLEDRRYCVGLRTKKYTSSGLSGLTESSPDLLQAEVVIRNPGTVLNCLVGQADLGSEQRRLLKPQSPALLKGRALEQALTDLKNWKETITRTRDSFRKTARVLHAYSAKLNTTQYRIMDSGLAVETAVSVTSRISKQATSAVLAQANQNAARAVPLLQAA